MITNREKEWLCCKFNRFMGAGLLHLICMPQRVHIFLPKNYLMTGES